jgi:hypothetical protein
MIVLLHTSISIVMETLPGCNSNNIVDADGVHNLEVKHGIDERRVLEMSEVGLPDLIRHDNAAFQEAGPGRAVQKRS